MDLVGIGPGCSEKVTGGWVEACRRWAMGTAGDWSDCCSKFAIELATAVAVRDARAQRFDTVVLCDAAFR